MGYILMAVLVAIVILGVIFGDDDEPHGGSGLYAI